MTLALGGPHMGRPGGLSSASSNASHKYQSLCSSRAGAHGVPQVARGPEEEARCHGHGRYEERRVPCRVLQQSAWDLGWGLHLGWHLGEGTPQVVPACRPASWAALGSTWVALGHLHLAIMQSVAAKLWHRQPLQTSVLHVPQSTSLTAASSAHTQVEAMILKKNLKEVENQTVEDALCMGERGVECMRKSRAWSCLVHVWCDLYLPNTSICAVPADRLMAESRRLEA